MAALYREYPFPFWIAAGLLAIFVITVIRYHLSGWPLLARRFRTDRPQPAYASLNSVNFRHVVFYKLDVMVAGEPGGLHLAFYPALGRPRLFIPWDEIDFLPRYNWMLVRYQPVRLGREERVRCIIFASSADRFLRQANRQSLEKLDKLGWGPNPNDPTYSTPPTPPPAISPR